MDINSIIRAAWNRKNPENMDFIEQKLYWAMRSISFLYVHGELSRDEASAVKRNLIDSYERLREDWVRWKRNQAAYELLMTSSNTEVRRIAREVEGMFHE